MTEKRYHLNEKGEPGECNAEKRACPLRREDGSPADHYVTPEAAKEAYEREQRERYGVLTTHRKPAAKLAGSFQAFGQGLLKEGERLDLTEKGGFQVVEALVLPEETRGTGRGSEVMEALAEEANRRGLKLALTPSTDYGASSTTRLKKFYKRFGFVENKGRNKDYSTREAMIRLPRDS